MSNVHLDNIKTLNLLGAMKVTPSKLKRAKLDFKASYEKQQEKN